MINLIHKKVLYKLLRAIPILQQSIKVEVSPELELAYEKYLRQCKKLFRNAQSKKMNKKAYFLKMICNSQEVDRDKIIQISFYFATSCYIKKNSNWKRQNMQILHCRYNVDTLQIL